MSTTPPPPPQLLTMPHAEFAGRFGTAAVAGAVYGYTREADTHAVLTLLTYARPRRVLEIGTALGHMTANFTRWTLDDTQIFSLGIVQGMERSAPGAIEQQVDQPTRGQFGQFANHFGKAWKVLFVQADSMLYDLGRLAPLDFVFIDGGHDLEHALNDSRKAYSALSPSGWLVWHDFNSSTPWVKVREAIERLGFAEPVVHIEGTEVALLRKQAPLPPLPENPTHSGPVRVAWEGEPAWPAFAGDRQPGTLPGSPGSWPRSWLDLGFIACRRDPGKRACCARQNAGSAVGAKAGRWAGAGFRAECKTPTFCQATGSYLGRV